MPQNATNSQDGDFVKFCGLLKKPQLYKDSIGLQNGFDPIVYLLCSLHATLFLPVYVAVPKQSTEYQYWKHTEVSLPV